MDFRPGHRIDRYELICPIAQGGMGAVWLARVRKMNDFERFFALKTVLPQHASDDKLRAMFLDEARIASAIVHPNVANIVDVGEEGGTPYLVMEWIDGDSLQTLNKVVVQQGHSIPLGIMLRIVCDACSGLHAVHEVKGRNGHSMDVIHRDISPHNILVTPQGQGKVIDFGIAKSRDRSLENTTSSGSLKGKIRYMSPEQVTGLAVDRRTDIWATGVVMYTLAAGAPPFDGDNDVAVLRKLLEGAPIPPLPGDVPAPIARVITRCLSFDPNLRFASAADLQYAIEEGMRDARLRTTANDVAGFVGAKLAERAIARRARIEAALRELESAPGADASTLRPLASSAGDWDMGSEGRALPAGPRVERRQTTLGIAPSPPPPHPSGAGSDTAGALDVSIFLESEAAAADIPDTTGTLASGFLQPEFPASFAKNGNVRRVQWLAAIGSAGALSMLIIVSMIRGNPKSAAANSPETSIAFPGAAGVARDGPHATDDLSLAAPGGGSRGAGTSPVVSAGTQSPKASSDTRADSGSADSSHNGEGERAPSSSGSLPVRPSPHRPLVPPQPAVRPARPNAPGAFYVPANGDRK